MDKSKARHYINQLTAMFEKNNMHTDAAQKYYIEFFQQLTEQQAQKIVDKVVATASFFPKISELQAHKTAIGADIAVALQKVTNAEYCRVCCDRGIVLYEKWIEDVQRHYEYFCYCNNCDKGVHERERGYEQPDLSEVITKLGLRVDINIALKVRHCGDGMHINLTDYEAGLNGVFNNSSHVQVDKETVEMQMTQIFNGIENVKIESEV